MGDYVSLSASLLIMWNNTKSYATKDEIIENVDEHDHHQIFKTNSTKKINCRGINSLVYLYIVSLFIYIYTHTQALIL